MLIHRKCEFCGKNGYCNIIEDEKWICYTCFAFKIWDELKAEFEKEAKEKNERNKV